MMYGLKTQTIQGIQEVFKQYPEVEKAILYGSRAKGNYHPGSDIDLTLIGEQLNLTILQKIENEIDELLLPYKIDLSLHKQIQNAELLEHIKRVGKVFFDKNERVQTKNPVQDSRSMSEWKEYKLGDIVVLNYGKSLQEYKRLGGKIPVYSSAGITGWHNDPLINDAGIIIGRKGTIGSVYYSDKPFFAIDTTYYISRNDEKYNLKFLYYLLLSLGLETLNEDSAVPGLNRNTAYSQDILLPPLPEQAAIAEVLSSLDDKIDLLHRQNKTLEQLAETLFRQWFVEDNQNLKPLGELAKVTTGKGLKRAEFIQKGTYPIIGANGEIGRTDNYLTDERLIITGRVGTLGEVKITDDKVWISDNVLIIKPNEEIYFYPIYFTLKKFDFENINAGSTQPLITQTDLKKIDISFGELENLTEFQEFCKEHFQKIKSNTQQIRTLTQLRDTLLPKLMSGEVRVNIKDTITI
jgi:type I restriction enzyme S subunit